MPVFWKVTVAILWLSFFKNSGSVAGLSVRRFGIPCSAGEFLNPETLRCAACTRSCPGRLVLTRPCRPDADAVCGEPDVAGVTKDIKRSETKPCPFDAFLNRGTGLCQACTRFCVPPLVMTSPCERESDAVCRGPPTAEARRPKKAKTSSSRLAIKRRRDRKRRRKERQKLNHGLPTHHRLHSGTSAQLCGGDGSQFYDLRRGRCVTCRRCDTPGLEEYQPCTSSTDRVCRLARRRPAGGGLITTENPSLFEGLMESNELPEEAGSRWQLINRSHSNKYPDVRVEFTSNGQRQPRPPDIVGSGEKATGDRRADSRSSTRINTSE